MDKNSDDLKKMFLLNIEFLKERTNSKKIDFIEGGSKKAILSSIKDKNIGLEFSRQK